MTIHSGAGGGATGRDLLTDRWRDTDHHFNSPNGTINVTILRSVKTANAKSDISKDYQSEHAGTCFTPP